MHPPEQTEGNGEDETGEPAEQPAPEQSEGQQELFQREPFVINWGPPAPVDPITEKYDPGEHREHTRAQLAGGLAILLAVVALLLVVLTAFDALSIRESKDLASIIFAPIVVLTGTALGFYFGVHQNGRNGRE